MHNSSTDNTHIDAIIPGYNLRWRDVDLDTTIPGAVLTWKEARSAHRWLDKCCMLFEAHGFIVCRPPGKRIGAFVQYDLPNNRCLMFQCDGLLRAVGNPGFPDDFRAPVFRSWKAITTLILEVKRSAGVGGSYLS